MNATKLPLTRRYCDMVEDKLLRRYKGHIPEKFVRLLVLHTAFMSAEEQLLIAKEEKKKREQLNNKIRL